MKRYEITGMTNSGEFKTTSNLTLLKLSEEVEWDEEEFDSIAGLDVGARFNADHFTVRRTD